MPDHELTADEYARLPAPDETTLRKLRAQEARASDESLTDEPAEAQGTVPAEPQSIEERVGKTEVDVSGPDPDESPDYYVDHTGKVQSQPDAYDRADVQRFEQEHVEVDSEPDVDASDEAQLDVSAEGVAAEPAEPVNEDEPTRDYDEEDDLIG